MEHANPSSASSGSGTVCSRTAGDESGAGRFTVRIRRKYLVNHGQIAEKLSVLFGVRLGPEQASACALDASQYAIFQVISDQSGSITDEAGNAVKGCDTQGLAPSGGCVAARATVAGGFVCGDLITQIQVSLNETKRFRKTCEMTLKLVYQKQSASISIKHDRSTQMTQCLLVFCLGWLISETQR